MERRLLWAVLFGLLLQGSIAFPRGADSPSSESESNEDDTQQQQQQTIDTQSLGEFTKKIKTKGRPATNEKITEVPDLDDPCLDRKKIGFCKAAVPRFYLNKAEGKCEFFTYGGCGGNRNNFKGLSECETTCAKHLKKEVPAFTPKVIPAAGSSSEEQEDICNLPAMLNSDGVMCMAYMPRWTYKAAEKKCKPFTYGGCGGTKNIFGNKAECESRCGNDKSATTEVPTPTSNSALAGSDACSLPMDKGFCYAIKYKYFFNKLDNRCEKFEYGGCGGNANRFHTADDCVRTCGGDAPAHDTECAEVDCPWGLYTHYTSLDCKPIYDGQACCPTRFECPDNQQLNNAVDGARSLTLPTEQPPQPQCSYKGKSYAIGANVPEASDPGSCRAACICTREYSAGQGAKITCANIECPEQLGPYTPGCLPLYKRGSCCAYDSFCPNTTLTVIEPQTPEGETEPQTGENFKCEVDGKGYFEGQRFYPKKSPCLKCLCQKGFNGTISEQFCENIDCGIEIYYSHYLAKGCAPVYFQSEDGTSSCCPISWECPEDRREMTILPMPVGPSPPIDVGPLPPRPVGPVPPTRPVGTSPVTVTPSTESSLVEPTNPTPSVFPPKPQRDGRRILVTVEACQLPKEVGNCKANRRRYFYNNETSTCEEFSFSGCRGNVNNFASIQDCQRLCTPNPSDNKGLLRSLDLNQQEPQPRAIYVTEEDVCTMTKTQGNCKGFFPRFWYSPEDNSCKSFIFGGCRGNGNNFYTRESCEATCSNSISSGDASMVHFGDVPNPATNGRSVSLDVDPCSLPKKTGFCKASIRRFHYDSVTKDCKEFIYGGCGGNSNNFLNSQECENRCLVKEVGAPRTRSRIQVQPTQENNSSAPEAIGSRPPSFGFLERCRLPRQSGSCLGIRPSYYYDADTGTCNFFFYSGCFGNANRFTSVEECESACKNHTTVTNEQEGIGGRISLNRNSNSWRSSVTGDDDGSAGNDMVQPVRPQSSSSNSVRNHKEENDKDICKIAPEAGRCKAYVLRYHWDAVTKKCLPFIWSGCRGNKNNFLTESDCLSVCGDHPTIEQLTSEGVLSCSFGNETLPLGATVGGHGHRYSPDKMPCGVPVCQCLTPPSVTCVQLMCPTPPPEPVTEKVCVTPSCGSNCQLTVGLDGCPTCDCDDESQQVQVQEPDEVFVKSVKG